MTILTDVEFLDEPAVEAIGRLDSKSKKIIFGGNGEEMVKNMNLSDNELVLIRIYKIDYRK